MEKMLIWIRLDKKSGKSIDKSIIKKNIELLTNHKLSVV
jgi:hypothetical protein